jgi:hypothetical protein
MLASADPGAYRAHALGRALIKEGSGAHSASTSLSVGAGFPGLASEGYYPADAQVAVGPSDVVEMTNTRVRVFTRRGVPLDVFPMSDILAQHHADDMSDPQVAWDPTVQRWIAAGMDLTTNQTDIAISDGTDPLGSWEAYWWSFGSSACPDQPRLGFSSALVVVATELFDTNCHSSLNGNRNIGGVMLVISKQAMLSQASSIEADQYGPSLTYVNYVPVQMLAASDLDYVASTNYGTSNYVHVFTLTGVPPNDTLTEQDSLLIHPLQDPGVEASERGGSLVDAGDDRLNDATWFGGTLYLAADDRCTYPSDPYLETCVRVMELSTASQPTLTGENDIGWPSDDAYYGALRPDSHGNAIIVFDYSGPHDWPSVGVTAALGQISGEQGGAFTDALILASGTSPTVERWGDYSGAALDPTNPDIVWTVGQVADGLGQPGRKQNWATHIDAVSVTTTLSPWPNEVYPGEIYKGLTSQHQKIQLHPSGGGAHIYSFRATVRLPCRRGGYDTTTFQLPRETQKSISGSGEFQTNVRYGANRYAYGSSFSISGRFSNEYSVAGTLSATEHDRKYGLCTSGRVHYTAYI